MTNRFFFLLLALLVCVSTGCNDGNSLTSESSFIIRENQRLLTHSYAKFRSNQISSPTYNLSIELGNESSNFTGEVIINFLLSANNISDLTLDFDSGTIDKMEVNGQVFDPEFERWFITVPAELLIPNANNTVSISYYRPYATDGAGLHRFIDPQDNRTYLYTNFEPYDANRWFPHFDQPDLKASLTLQVSTPTGWEVIANTMPESVVKNESSLYWTFPTTLPLSSYIFAMHAGPYFSWESEVDGLLLRLFVRQSLAQFVDTKEWFIPTQKHMSFFQQWFDVPYPFDKYDQVIVPDFNAGAMENAAAVTFNERYLSRGVRSVAQKRSLSSVIAHEMAHMWFGDLVTMAWWNGLWLNESFATYMANLALDASGDFDNVWDYFYLRSKLSAYAADTLVTTHSIELPVKDTGAAFANFDSITYGKGGAVLNQLPYLIGEENFRQGIHDYLQEHSFSNTSLSDFVGALSRRSGIDLQQWEQDWLHTSGVNTVRAEFTCEDNLLTGLILQQKASTIPGADNNLRTQRTQIALFEQVGDELKATTVIPVTYSGSSTEIPVPTQTTCPSLVLPNLGDWAYMQIELDDISQLTLEKQISNVSDPMTRLMLWQSLLESMRSGEISIADFLAMLISNSTTEKDYNVQTFISSTFSEVESLLQALNLDNSAILQKQIEDSLLTLTNNAEAGSESQKIWFYGLLSVSSSVNALDILEDILDEKLTLPGLPIDQDIRWQIIKRLNRFEHNDYRERLEIESGQDISDFGENEALAARASRPDLAIKEEWIDLMLKNPESYKLATMRKIMGSLFPPEQSGLIVALRERVLSSIPALSQLASQEFLGEYAAYFSMSTCDEASVYRLQQVQETESNLHSAIVKAYRVHLQEAKECFQIRQSNSGH